MMKTKKRLKRLERALERQIAVDAAFLGYLEADMRCTWMTSAQDLASMLKRALDKGVGL